MCTRPHTHAYCTVYQCMNADCCASALQRPSALECFRNTGIGSNDVFLKILWTFSEWYGNYCFARSTVHKNGDAADASIGKKWSWNKAKTSKSKLTKNLWPNKLFSLDEASMKWNLSTECIDEINGPFQFPNKTESHCFFKLNIVYLTFYMIC